MKALYQGPMWPGSTTLQRCQAMATLQGVEVTPLDSRAGRPTAQRPSLYRRVRGRLRWPVDDRGENDELLETAARERANVVIIEASQVIQRETLRKLRRLGVSTLAYYTPDDIVAWHNLTWPLRLTFPEWDVFFTTKTFNVSELAARGVRRPVLIGKAFDPALHRPMTREEVGEDFERWDIVFVGTFERERCASINRLARCGMRVVVYGNGWSRSLLSPGVDLRPPMLGPDYARALHTGKIALCFLRKLNRDRITQRTMEIAAMRRPMLAEKTDEHDEHFIDGAEYVGFADDEDLAAKAMLLLTDSDRRFRLAREGRERCLTSGYSTIARAEKMAAELGIAVDRHATAKV